MGTYDTRGGHPISPMIEEPMIFDEEGEVIDLLEAAEVEVEVIDKVLAIVTTLCEKAYLREEVDSKKQMK